MADPLGEGITGWAAGTAREDAGIDALARPRSVSEGAAIELREVTDETVRAICRLLVAPSQRRFVAPNAVAFAEALFEPKAWPRAVYADGVPVGFLMLEDDPEAASYFLWRLMIAEDFQGRGYGRRAIERGARPDPPTRNRAHDELGARRRWSGAVLSRAGVRADRRDRRRGGRGAAVALTRYRIGT